MLAVAANLATTGTEGQVTACLSRELYGARHSCLHILRHETRTAATSYSKYLTVTSSSLHRVNMSRSPKSQFCHYNARYIEWTIS